MSPSWQYLQLPQWGIASLWRRDNQYGQRQLRQRTASRCPTEVLAALRRFRLVEYHHLGDEGFHFTDVCQAANSCDFAKVLSRVADIIRPVIILREKVEQSLIIWLVAAL
jgi:hypothetical protein